MLIIQCSADGWNHSIKAVQVQQAHHAGQAKDDRIDNAYFKRLGGYLSELPLFASLLLTKNSATCDEFNLQSLRESKAFTEGV